MPLDRNKCLEAVKNSLEQNMLFHSLALESCLGGIYDHLDALNRLGPDDGTRENWTLAGLLHDIDYAGEFKSEHPNKTAEAAAKYGLLISEPILRIIKAHAPKATGVEPKNKAEWAIFCADSLTGLITAVAYVIPSKKIADVKLSSVVKRFLKEPRFAAGTRREEVAQCAQADGLNIPVEKFIEICLEAMKKIAGEIGL
jgi:predicted hydrolase (HD superfamily)